MSREAKIFDGNGQDINLRVKEYESFGWELLSINGNDVSMSRETQNKVYTELIKYEYNYEELREQQRNLVYPIKPKPFDFLLALILLVLAVLPGVLYITLKIMQNKKFKEDDLAFRTEWNRLNVEIKNICDKSRATFFSRQ